MNEPSRWRFAIAQRIAAVTAVNPKVAAVLLGGSVPLGYADRFSDLELYVFWADPPFDDDRAAAIALAGGSVLRLRPRNESEEWSDVYIVDGVRVDGSHFTVESIDRIAADVLERFDTTFGKQVLLWTFAQGVPLHGEPVITRWRDRAAHYPDGLMTAMVRENIEFGSRSMLLMLVERNDPLPLYKRMAEESIKILRVCLGLNRIYDPGIKWLHHTVARFRLAPRDLEPRLWGVFVQSPAIGVHTLHTLIEDTFDLVDEHLPEVDTGPAREWFELGRSPIGPL